MLPAWQGTVTASVASASGLVQLDLDHEVNRVLMSPEEARELSRQLEAAAKEAQPAVGS